MVKKSKLRKAKKPSSNLKKMKEASGVRQSVNVVVNLAERRRQQPRAIKKGAVMKKGEPLLPSSATARTPVEVKTTNTITEDARKAIQDEARSEYTQRLLESEKKVLAIQQQQTKQQELLEDQAELIIKGKKALDFGLFKKQQPPLQESPNIKRVRGKDKSPRKRKGEGNIATPQTVYETSKIETPQFEEPVRFMEGEEEERSQDGS